VADGAARLVRRWELDPDHLVMRSGAAALDAIFELDLESLERLRA